MLASCFRPSVRPVSLQRAATPQAGAARLSCRACSTYVGQVLHLHRPKVPQLQGCRRPRQLQLVQASIFGVGAPEAILVGVVALLVFGPKGLAQAAKSLGQTLRAFQPTIRELTQVSAELKSTLESEIGINEIKEELRRPVTGVSRALDETISGTGTAGAANSAPVQGAGLQELADGMTAQVKGAREDMARVVDPDIERKREEAAKLAWGAAAGSAAAAPPAHSTDASCSGSRGSAAEPAVQLDSLSVEQLEAELQRRKAAAAAAQQQQVPKKLRADD